MPEGSGIVSSTTRYADDTVAQLVVEMYPEGVPGDIVGELLGITRQRVSQIEIRALSKLRGSKRAGVDLWEMFNEHHVFTEHTMKKRQDSGLRIMPFLRRSV
jgi:transcriptional regulator